MAATAMMSSRNLASRAKAGDVAEAAGAAGAAVGAGAQAAVRVAAAGTGAHAPARVRLPPAAVRCSWRSLAMHCEALGNAARAHAFTLCHSTDTTITD